MTQSGSYDVNAIRREFPILKKSINGYPLVYLDSAASAQKPLSVIEAQREYEAHFHSNIHRGVHTLATQATEAFESVRTKIADHINAAQREEIIFTSGTTDGINLVAGTWGRANLNEEDTIVLSRLEHHSNIVPWQILATEKRFKIEVIELNEDGSLDESSLNEKLALNPKMVAISHVSNTLGTVNDVKRITALAHSVGATVIVDGSQAVPHKTIDVTDIDCDFYVASGHKMYGPSGIGFLYGKHSLLEQMPPWRGGGEMIASVSFEEPTTFNIPPYKFEAGTPHLSGVVGLGAAIDWLNSVGLEKIAAHEKSLIEYASGELMKIDGMKLIGTAPAKASVISFLVEGIHPSDIGTLLDGLGIAVRTGHHCTEPIMTKLGIPGTVRASFAAYSTKAEVDALVAGVNRAVKLLR
ncbi:MAG: cysteine desulfurase CsdA [Crocinitomicaceae bacterium]|mgnify:CR=1 FL=1|nr:cysteine desulfurase CsdA [Crocinitomicaceae bacterium]